MSAPIPGRRHATLIALTCVGLLGPAVTAHAVPGYPRLGLYGGIQGIGFPFITGGDRDGPLDYAMCDSVARYDEVILDASPISEYRPDVLTALRARHPDLTLLAYVTAEYIWPASEPDSNVHFPTRFRRLVRDRNGFLYRRDGGYFSVANVNMAKRDASGRYIVAEGLADLFYDA